MAGQLTISTLNDSSGVLATQNGMRGIAKAWVYFDSTPTIVASFNVSSVTRSSTALYTINFTTSMGSTSYACFGSAGAGVANVSANAIITNTNPINATSCFFNTRNGINADSSYSVNCVSVFI